MKKKRKNDKNLRPQYISVRKLHELTSQYMELEPDLPNAGEKSNLYTEIESAAMELLRINTDLSQDDLINILDEHFIKSGERKDSL